MENAEQTARNEVYVMGSGAGLTFGSYRGTPVRWRVLDREAYSFLLLSEYGIDVQPFNTDPDIGDADWEICTLREWLNRAFYNSAFAADERALIQLPPSLDNARGRNSRDAVKDKIFLLSTDEVKRYLRDDASRICIPTQYAAEHGADTAAASLAGRRVVGCKWWLRSPGMFANYTACVSPGGALQQSDSLVHDERGCVRPAMWISMIS